MEHYIRKTYQVNCISPTLEMCLIRRQTGQQTFDIAEYFWSSSANGVQKQEAIQVPVKSFFNQECVNQPSLF